MIHTDLFVISLLRELFVFRRLPNWFVPDWLPEALITSPPLCWGMGIMLVLIWLMLHANIWEHLHAARYAEDDMASHLHRAYALIVVVVVYALHSLPAPFRLEYAVSGFVLMVSGLIISWPLYRFGVASQYQEKG